MFLSISLVNTPPRVSIPRDNGTTGGYDRVYTLKKFERSNQGTCLNQHPIVSTGDKVKKGAILADGPATCDGELSLGRNILIGFMTWEGYNYEDAILLSEKLVQNDVFTSIHIEEHEIECRETRLIAQSGGDNGRFMTTAWFIFGNTNSSNPGTIITVTTIGVLFTLLNTPLIVLTRVLVKKLTPDLS